MPRAGRLGGQVQPGRLAVAGPRVDQQHAVPGRRRPVAARRSNSVAASGPSAYRPATANTTSSTIWSQEQRQPDQQNQRQGQHRHQHRDQPHRAAPGQRVPGGDGQQHHHHDQHHQVVRLGEEVFHAGGDRVDRSGQRDHGGQASEERHTLTLACAAPPGKVDDWPLCGAVFWCLLTSGPMQPSTVLAVLAELAPAGGDRVLDVTRGGAAAGLAHRRRTRTPQGRDRPARRPRRPAPRGAHPAPRLGLPGRRAPRSAEARARSGCRCSASRCAWTGPSAATGSCRPATSRSPRWSRTATWPPAMEAAPGLATPGWLTAIGTPAWLWSVGEATGLPVDALTTAHQRLPPTAWCWSRGPPCSWSATSSAAALSDSLRSWAGRDLSGDRAAGPSTAIASGAARARSTSRCCRRCR